MIEPPAPTRLFSLPESAYGTTLIVDADATYLLTRDAAYRLVVGQDALKMPLAFGNGPTATRDAFVFWSDGAVFQAPKKGGKPQRIASLPHEPQRFIASSEHFAWLDHADDGRYTIQALRDGKPRVLHTSRAEVDTIALFAEQIVFVERATDGKWRFAAVSLKGGEPIYSPEHTGRTPAMLAVDQGVHYYDGNSLEIRRLAPDLQSETTLLKGSICSPLAVVGPDLYCASVDGPLRVSLPEQKPIALSPSGGRTITSLAAGPGRVVWVRDEGAQALAVETVNVASRGAP